MSGRDLEVYIVVETTTGLHPEVGPEIQVFPGSNGVFEGAHIWAKIAEGGEGTVNRVDPSSKTIAVKTADGVEHTIYYTETAGHKVAHFLKKSN